MKKYLLFVLLIALLITVVNAQKNTTRFATSADVSSDSLKVKSISKSCNLYSNYIPDTLHPEFTPTRLVRVNFHIIQDGKGQNNFSEREGRAFALQLIQDANQRLGSNHKMFLPKDNTTPALPVQYRYVLTGDPSIHGDDGIYFHRDDTLFAMNKKSKKKDNVYDRRQYDTYGVQKEKVINIFLMEHYPDSAKSPTYKASNDGVGSGPWVKLVGQYYLVKHPNITSSGDTIKYTTWNLAGLMNHELGHCFGLSHTWNTNDGCDDTPQSAGCWNFGPPPCDVCSNNVMDYNAYQSALTPCQLGKVSLSFYTDRAARKYLIPDWCIYDPEKSITIPSGESIDWGGSMDVFGDLIVEKKATLTIHCIVSMPPGSKIILKPKATLILDGATITSRCDNGLWEGIEITSTKKNNPSIILRNGATLDKVKNLL